MVREGIISRSLVKKERLVEFPPGIYPRPNGAGTNDTRIGNPRTVCDEPVTSLDISGTIAAPGGTPIPPRRPLDRGNLIPDPADAKDGEPHEVPSKRWFDQNRHLVRQGDGRLVIPARNTKAGLYNLADDLREENDLAAGKPGVPAELEKLRVAREAELIERRFTGLSEDNA